MSPDDSAAPEPDTATMPAVVGKTVARAIELLDAEGITNVTWKDCKCDATAPIVDPQDHLEKTVSCQVPSAGQSASGGATAGIALPGCEH